MQEPGLQSIHTMFQSSPEKAVVKENVGQRQAL